MPITRSAKKALRQSIKRKKQNVRRKTKFRSLVKEFKKSVAAKETNKAKELMPKVYQALDKAAKTNAIKKNTASRLKSRLSQYLTKNLA